MNDPRFWITALPEFQKLTQINQAAVADVQPDMDMVQQFFGALYPQVHAGIVHLRGIAEPKDGRPGENHHIRLDHNFFDNIERFVRGCARDNRAAFVLPGTVREGGTGKSDVLSLPAVLVDFDKGDPEKNLAAVEALLGLATIVIESGGLTDDGRVKLHAHWRLAEPATGSDIERVCQLRETLAVRFQGDKAFKQAGQVVRVGGGVHHKAGARLSKVRTVRQDTEYALGDLCRALGIGEPQSPTIASSNVLPFDFSRDKIAPTVDQLREMPRVETEGGSGINRFEWFTRVAGAELADAWHGRKSLEDAVAYVKGKIADRFDKPEDWDDARVEREMQALWKVHVANHGAPPGVQERGGLSEWADFNRWTGASEKYQGAPTPRKYLIDGVLPLGVPALLCASGGLGKSFLMLDLARRVATGKPTAGIDFNPEQLILGGAVKEFGTAVIFCAEDDRQTIHERLLALDPAGQWRTDRLRPIPLPDAGGPRALFAADREGYKTTAAFEAVRAWLKTLTDLKLVVFDPLQTLVAADITSKPEAGQFVMASLGTLAVELGATVLVTHHMKKTDNPISTSEEARAAMRGTTALVDGVRFAYGLWEASGDGGADAAGAVVKTNGRRDTTIHRYARLPCGVLRQLPPAFDPAAREEALACLVSAIAAAAKDGYPFTTTGENGLFRQQHRLPAPFKSMERARLEATAKQLLLQGRIVKGTARGSKNRGVLDVPEGDFALGHGVVMNGAGAAAA